MNTESIILKYHEPEPEPGKQLSSEEYQYYEDLFLEIVLNDKTYDILIEQILNGYDGDFSERVPDNFLEQIYKYHYWASLDKENKHKIDEWVRLSCNTDRSLRSLYTFWKHVCGAKITKDPRCFITLLAIRDVCHKWIREQEDYIFILLWGGADKETQHNKAYSTVNDNNLVKNIMKYLYNPARVSRLSLSHIRQMVEPAFEN